MSVCVCVCVCVCVLLLFLSLVLLRAVIKQLLVHLHEEFQGVVDQTVDRPDGDSQQDIRQVFHIKGHTTFVACMLLL